MDSDLMRWVKAQADDPNANPRFRELLAALEAAREDAERLDWLDANGSAVRLKGNSRRNLIIWGAVHVPSYRTIRNAIDHAREEEVQDEA
jgi:hypothetical protein